MFKQLLVPIDGSELTKKALKKVAVLAKLLISPCKYLGMAKANRWPKSAATVPSITRGKALLA